MSSVSRHAVIVACLHDQQVDVAVGAHVPARGGSEHHDALRLSHLDDPTKDLLQSGGVGFARCPFASHLSEGTPGR